MTSHPVRLNTPALGKATSSCLPRLPPHTEQGQWATNSHENPNQQESSAAAISALIWLPALPLPTHQQNSLWNGITLQGNRGGRSSRPRAPPAPHSCTCGMCRGSLGMEKVFGGRKISGDPSLMPGLEEAMIQVQESLFPMATGPWVPCANPTALSDPWVWGQIPFQSFQPPPPAPQSQGWFASTA